MNTLDDPRHDREAGSRRSTHDTTRIDDTRIDAVRPLITPALLHERLPVGETAQALVEQARSEIADVLHGWSAEGIGTAATTAGGGLLVIVGVVVAAIVLPAFVRYRISEQMMR